MSVTLQVHKHRSAEYVLVTGIATSSGLARFCRSLCGWSVFDTYPAVIVELDAAHVLAGRVAGAATKAAVDLWRAQGRWVGFVVPGLMPRSATPSNVFASRVEALEAAFTGVPGGSRHRPDRPDSGPDGWPDGWHGPTDMRHVKMADAMADVARHEPADASAVSTQPAEGRTEGRATRTRSGRP